MVLHSGRGIQGGRRPMMADLVALVDIIQQIQYSYWGVRLGDLPIILNEMNDMWYAMAQRSLRNYMLHVDYMQEMWLWRAV